MRAPNCKIGKFLIKYFDRFYIIEYDGQEMFRFSQVWENRFGLELILNFMFTSGQEDFLRLIKNFRERVHIHNNYLDGLD
jgi:hypothetical protein